MWNFMRNHSSSEPDSEREPAPDPFGNVRKFGVGMVGSLVDYLHLRITLLSIEAREAKVAILSGILLLAAGSLFIVLGWIGFWIGIVPVIAKATGASWETVGILVALGHIALGVGSIFFGKSRFSHSLFQDTAQEFRKDREWLERTRSPRR